MCKFNAMECRLMTIVEICNFNVHQTVMLRMKKRLPSDVKSFSMEINVETCQRGEDEDENQTKDCGN